MLFSSGIFAPSGAFSYNLSVTYTLASPRREGLRTANDTRITSATNTMASAFTTIASSDQLEYVSLKLLVLSKIHLASCRNYKCFEGVQCAFGRRNINPDTQIYFGYSCISCGGCSAIFLYIENRQKSKN